MAVLDLEGRGISSHEAASLTDRLRSELVYTGEVIMVERGQMEQVLAEQDFQLTGCTSDECAVEVGQLLGVTTMVAGTIGKVGSTYSLDIRTIDVATGRITQSIMRDYRGEIDGLLNEMRYLARELARVSELEPDAQQLLRPPTTAKSPLGSMMETFLKGMRQESMPKMLKNQYEYELSTDILASSYNASSNNILGISAGYYPRSFSEDQPVGVLPFNNKNRFIILSGSTAESVTSIALSGRYTLKEKWDIRGNYSVNKFDVTTKSALNLGLGAYFGKYYLRYVIYTSRDNGEPPSGKVNRVYEVKFSHYQSDYNTWYINYHSDYYESESGYYSSTWNITGGTSKLSPQWIFYDIHYNLRLRAWESGGDRETSSTHYLTGYLKYYLNRTLSVGIGLNLMTGQGSTRSFSASVSKYLRDLIKISFNYTSAQSKLTIMFLKVSYLL
ncbi:MAG: hypothetical protein GH143_05725 [Calditrichaeota bacterium]|nr:hypothetical protein [Calditrichota bacterium]